MQSNARTSSPTNAGRNKSGSSRTGSPVGCGRAGTGSSVANQTLATGEVFGSELDGSKAEPPANRRYPFGEGCEEKAAALVRTMTSASRSMSFLASGGQRDGIGSQLANGIK